MTVVLFGVAGIAQADLRPFVNISATSESLEFGKPTLLDTDSDIYHAPGQITFPGIHYASSAALTLQVESNCMHGPIVAEITALKQSRGNSIPPERIFIKAPTTNGYVAMGRPVAISKPKIGSHNIEMNFWVDIFPHDDAGIYKGIITFTIMPPP